MKLWKRIGILVMALLFIACLLPVRTAEAENACDMISGSSGETEVFYVNTGSRWFYKNDEIKFKQTKGIMKVHRDLLGDAIYHQHPPFSEQYNDTRKMNETYTVTVEKLNNKNEVTETKNYVFDGSSLTIDELEQNSKYRITVAPTFQTFYNEHADDSFQEWITRGVHKNPYASGITDIAFMEWVPLGWETHSTWTVTGTKGIDDCGFSNGTGA